MRFQASIPPLLFVAALLLGSGAAAQQPPAQDAPAPETPAATASPAATGEGETAAKPAGTTIAVDSPRASLQRYLDLAREGRFREAARYLDVPASQRDEAAALARKLKAVLDRHLWFDMDKISPETAGAAEEGLPPEFEDVGQVPGPTGAPEPVRLVRRVDDRGPYWAFATSTVERIDPWYGGLKDRWIHEHLPEWALRPGPRDLLWWQWIALPILLLVSVLLGRLLGGATRWTMHRVAATTRSNWDDAIITRLGAPLTAAWALAAIWALVPWLNLYLPAQAFVHSLAKIGLFIVFFWAIWRTIDVIADLVLKLPWALELPASRSLVPLASRLTKVAILGIASIAVLSTLGYPVASLIAGLGIGGLAFALAAQKTVENLFGSVSIAVDQPIRVGDFVKIEDFVGTVELIGIRSTQVRTLDRTLISIPNGRLAEMRLETFAARDRIRFHATLGLVYGTTAAQMREVLQRFEETLRAHPKIWTEAVVVRFKEFGASSLDVEIMAWFLTSDWNEFTTIRQELLLAFMEIVEKAGSSFAFPTRTVHLVSDKRAEEELRASADGGTRS